MYMLLLAILIGLGAWMVHRGWTRDQKAPIIVGAVLILMSAGLPVLLDFWGEMLWFEALGYGERFWKIWVMQTGTVLAGGLIGFIGVRLVTWRVNRKIVGHWPELAGAVVGAFWGGRSWDEHLLFFNRVTTELTEPIFEQDTGFYLFTIPVLDSWFQLLLWIALISLVTVVMASFVRLENGEPHLHESAEDGKRADIGSLALALAVLAAVLAFGKILDGYHLLYSELGVVVGPGWTDVHVRLPAYWVLATVLVILGAAALVPALRLRLGKSGLQRIMPLKSAELAGIAVLWVAIGLIWFLSLGLVPAAVQWLVVEPNEITYETPYIAHNIHLTRHGFHLNKVEERQFPAAETFTQKDVEQNRQLLSNVRLWDWRALDAVYKQFQEIRLYYEFDDVDIDRYTISDRYRQVMVAARELEKSNLPPQSQTFVNLRFKFTHGYGLTLTTVNDFTPEGLPNLLIKDIPPQATTPDLQVERPQIYYGELTDGPVVVNSQQPEFDYPSGEKNVYIQYPGTGGVELSNGWRKFVYGWKFDGTQFLLSSYPTPESRIMFHRQIRERVSRLAPFLELDEDPYIVLVDGRLYWIIDAYTTSRYYPYSQPFSSREFIEYEDEGQGQRLLGEVAPYLDGVNYVRNAVKVIVDAFDGSVQLYIFEPDDPLVQAWSSALPGFFKPQSEMPTGLRAHVRYPSGLLLAQGLVYAKYHMEDPEVFYNQEDLWVRATEKYYAQVQPVQPYYVMWQLPQSERPEFVLILPFTPKNRQVLIGWIAGLSDGDNYGRFLAYKFPKEKRVLGPQQVETKIDQDRFLSGQLTLWDQRGSNVIRGNVLAIPIEGTLIYVEPIYLQAETAAYPELRLVIVMHGDTLSYGETFDEALQGLFEDGKAEPAVAPELEGTFEQLARQANEAFKSYLQLQGEQRFEAAAKELQVLRDALQRLVEGAETRPEQ